MKEYNEYFVKIATSIQENDHLLNKNKENRNDEIIFD